MHEQTKNKRRSFKRPADTRGTWNSCRVRSPGSPVLLRPPKTTQREEERNEERDEEREGETHHHRV